MPVENHSIHPSTQKGKDFRHGCWNLPRERRKVKVQDGWTDDGRRIIKEIDDFGSIECRNDHSLIDWFCIGCEWIGSGEEYARKVEMRAAMQDSVRVG